ncbi:PREDICTED: chondroitin proteoglycan 2-like [Eufriesea mexicana]|uniref:chondroitin proteoglycan 2-like n=1 Tax=Eufriesea mexicana TaxID=516756 RepID=UPI00083BAB3F|nr:PREDICTED: chondroitin proteoglycan 2-like [Eufriesea mexicana]
MTSTMIIRLLIPCSILGFASSINQNRFIGANQGDFAYTNTKQQTSISCPERNGRFPVPSECDAYIECIDGVPEEKLCPEGLLFNPEVRFNFPCGYPIDVDCDGRPNRQPPQPSEDCPHQYGYFKIGDHQNCGQFMNCAEGRGHIFDCPEGLAFNAESYRCDWPDQVPDCDAEAFLGFRCPEELSNPEHRYQIRFFRSILDCQRYYVCVNGRPRLQNCGAGRAFNELIDACDAAANVTGCDSLPLQLEKKTKLF